MSHFQEVKRMKKNRIKVLKWGMYTIEGSVAQPFGSNEENDNGPLNEEEYTNEEVQAFHHGSTQYFINGRHSDLMKEEALKVTGMSW